MLSKGIEKKLYEFVKEKNLTEFADLVDCLADENMMEEFNHVCNHPEFYIELLASRKRIQDKGIEG